MLFSKLIVAAAAFAVAQAAVQFTNPTFSTITAGMPFNLTWSGADGAVTLTLKDGPSTALVTVDTIASGLTGTSFVWNVPATLAANTYAIQIDDSSNVPNYSTEFQLIGGAASSSAAASSTSSGSSSTGSSSTSSSTGSSSTGSSTGSSTSIISSTSTGSSTTSTGSSTVTSKSSSTSASKTTSSGSSTTGSSTTSASSSAATTTAPDSAAGNLSSPVALVFLAFAAILTLN